MPKLTSVAELEMLRSALVAARAEKKLSITVCGGTGCRALGSEGVSKGIRAELDKQGLSSDVDLKITGCRGFCEQGTIVTVLPERVLYAKATARDAPAIVKAVTDSKPLERLLYKDKTKDKRYVHEEDIPFYAAQNRVLLENSGHIDQYKIDDYIAIGGYAALAKALTTMTPDSVIAEVKKSGLRGRGGAGFPAGIKWEICQKAKGDPKYIICNADEGDPGAFQDRSIIEGNPHCILEGMLIGAYAIGAVKAYVYIRHEYPLAVDVLRKASVQAEELGLIGDNVLGTGLKFELHIQLGAGAFVCGEETALMASVMGKVGEPTARPPFPAQSGLWGKPTNINNVKTWASVPHIINRGADWYASLGNEKSKGTSVFSLVGRINNTGLVEVPLGITLRQLVYDVGGGIPDGKKFKAIQTGGPSGGCIPERLLDLPIDYENLASAGSIMGSGGMIVMDEKTCMVDVAKYFTDFTKFESCGKCNACREGLRQMHAVLTRITAGDGQETDVALLEEMGAAIKDGAFCALGKTAPNPVLTTIRYFREEYDSHIRDKKCPAGICTDLITFFIIPENCNGCTICMKNCTENAIIGELHKLHVIDNDKCIRCGICLDVCNRDAVGVQ